MIFLKTLIYHYSKYNFLIGIFQLNHFEENYFLIKIIKL
jgi:hypothetical protein